MTEPHNTMSELTKEKLGDGAQEVWRCFHCGFVATTPEEAEAHFGDGDEGSEFVPVCKWWANSEDDERKRAYQDLLADLNQARAECHCRELEDRVAVLTEERDRMREALTKLLRHDSGCVVSGEAGSGNPECCGYCFAKAAHCWAGE